MSKKNIFNQKSNFNESQQENSILESMQEIDQSFIKKQEKQKKIKNIVKKTFIAIGGIAIITSAISGIKYGIDRHNVTKKVANINEYQISNIEYEYEKKLYMSEFYNSYFEYFEYWGLDYDEDLSTQYYDEENEITWQYYFDNMIESQITEKNLMYEEAIKNNYSDDKAVEESVKTFKENVKQNAFKKDVSINKYLSDTYLPSTKESDIEKIVRKYSLADSYINYYTKTYNISEEKVNEYYENNSKDIDVVDYRIFSFSVITEMNINSATNAISAESQILSNDDTSNESNEGNSSDSTNSDNSENENIEDTEEYKTAKEATLNKALNFYNQVYDEETFKNLCIENSSESSKYYFENYDYSLKKAKSYNSVDSSIADWLFTKGREEKSTAVIYDDDNYCYYVIYFINRYKQEEASNIVSGIFIPYETTDSASFKITDEDKEKAEETVNEIMLEWNSSDKTSEIFDSLVKRYSKDKTTNDDGTYDYTICPTFIKNWGNDETRVIGDMEQITRDEGIYILYYKEDGNETWYNKIENILKSEAYNEHISEVYQSASVEFTK